MKTVLIRPSDLQVDPLTPQVFTPPIGLWSMRENFPHVTVIDQDFDPLPDEIHADLVGYSLQFASQETALFNDLRPRVIAEREVLGAPHGCKMNVPGVETHCGPGEDLLAKKHIHIRDLALPTFSHEELTRYWEKNSSFGYPTTQRWMTLQTSRGCNHVCGWCTMPTFWGKWEGRFPSDISIYLRYLAKEHGVLELLILDDNVSFDPVRFIELITVFKLHDMRWQCPNGIYLRTLLHDGVFASLKGSRCDYMALPFEAGNLTSARLMGIGPKYHTKDEADLIIARLREAGVAHLKGLFVIGYPGETEEDVRATFTFGNSLDLDDRTFSIATPHKGSRMWKIAEDNGWILHDIPETPRTTMIDTPMLCRHTLERLKAEDREAAIARRSK